MDAKPELLNYQQFARDISDVCVIASIRERFCLKDKNC